MVEPNNVLIRDLMYDGGLTSIAIPIVTWYKESNGFTLNDWPSKDEYYTYFFSYWKSLKNKIKDMLELTQEEIHLVDKFDLALSNIYNETFIKPSMFLFVFLNSLYSVPEYQTLDDPIKVPDLLTEFDEYVTVKQLEDFIYNTDLIFPNVVPFLSKSGLFGFNTYLYLFFNNILPVSFSLEAMTVHGFLKNPIDIALHDLEHICELSGLINTPNICKSKFLDDDYDISDDLPDGISVNDYLNSLKKVYQQIMNMKHNIKINDNIEIIDKEIKGYIIILFYILHESIVPVCLSKHNKSNIRNDYLKSIDNDFIHTLKKLVPPMYLGIPDKYIVDLNEISIEDDNHYLWLSANRIYSRNAYLILEKRFCERFCKILYGNQCGEIYKKLDEVNIRLTNEIQPILRLMDSLGL